MACCGCSALDESWRLPPKFDRLMKYVKFAKLVILHSNHYICEECLQNLYDIAQQCDTNLSRCPECNEYIFLRD